MKPSIYPFIPPSIDRINAAPKKYKAMSFFAGCCGSSTGYKMAGFDIVYANEFVPIARTDYESNAAPHTIVDGRDIREVQAADLRKQLKLKVGELDFMDGSPPCASFSMAGRRDEQWGKPVPYSEKIVQRVDDLFDHYIRMIDGFKPKVFVAENVTGLALGEARGFLIEILESLGNLGYVVDARIIDASQLGLAQKRRRLIIMGVRNDVAKKLKITSSNLPYPKPLKKPIVTVSDVLPNIDRIRISKGDHAVFVVPDRPSPTITASDAINSLKSCMSCGAWVDDKEGVRRKYTIDEAKVLFGFPYDYRLSGRYVQQFERLGRSHSPCSTYYIGKAIIDHVLSKRGV